MGIHHYKHLKPLLPPNSFALKCTALVISSTVKDADETGDQSLNRNYIGQLLVSQTPAHSMVLSLYLKTRKTQEELSITINVVFVFIISRLLQFFPLYNYQHIIQPTDHMTC